MNRFSKSFQASFTITFIVLIAISHLCWLKKSATLPRRPVFIDLTKQYVGDDESCSVTHFLYRYGVMGMRNKLQRADLLLLGTSHMEFGISAREMSEQLTNTYKRPIHVYNLGMGGGESSDFTQLVLSNNRIRDTRALLDLHDPLDDNWSFLALQTNSLNSLQIYLRILESWLNYTHDWILDPILPRFRPFQQMKKIKKLSDSFKMFEPTRFLGYFSVRDWASGDLVYYWGPKSGILTLSAVPQPLNNTSSCLDFANQGVRINNKLIKYLRHNSVASFYTLVPFDGYDLATIPMGAVPYIRLSSENLFTFDRLHLVESSRMITTKSVSDFLIKNNAFERKTGQK